MTTRIAILLLALASAIPAHAVIVMPMTFEELVGEATAVVYVRVADVRGRWTADRRRSKASSPPKRSVTLKAISATALRCAFLAARRAVSSMSSLGHQCCGRAISWCSFSERAGRRFLTPVGLTQGVFRVTVDPREGTAVVMPPPLKASAVGRAVRGAADRRVLTLNAFAAEVRAVAEAQR